MEQRRGTNRREFLQGRSAAEALAHVAESALANDDSAAALESASAAYLLRVGRRAMACEFEVLLNAGQYADGTDQALAALDLVDALEAQMTVYRDTSEVAEINRRAFDAPVAVEPRLWHILQLAAQLHGETAGAYDITAGPLSKLWGFYRRRGEVPDQRAVAEALERVGMQRVQLNVQERTVRFLCPGMEFNLGSIGKGYALDRVAERLEAAGMGNFMLHGGQSSIVTRGDAGGESRGWSVGVVDPLRPGRRLATIWARNRGVGTSGASTQFFRHGGRRFGHILDPRTGWPAEGVLSATVVAESGALADALATAFYVMGPAAAMAYCEQHPGVAAILVAGNEGSGACEVRTIGFAEGDLMFEGTPALREPGGLGGKV
jgi:thiamine biosynthesis lipoprotein